MFTMLFGYSPFQNREEILYRQLLFNGLKPKDTDCISEDCKNILLGCLSRNMLERLTISDLVESNWLEYFPLPYSESNVSWDSGPINLYHIYSLDRYRSWSFVRRIGEPFEILYNLYAKKDKVPDSFVNRISRKDTKLGLATK
eukprot:NODE_2_length_91304_cov_0.692462.p69 type:complete len:143 gc:universal NODE_2_length_91304_cov_0.692462:23435-23863(+)